MKKIHKLFVLTVFSIFLILLSGCISIQDQPVITSAYAQLYDNTPTPAINIPDTNVWYDVNTFLINGVERNVDVNGYRFKILRDGIYLLSYEFSIDLPNNSRYVYGVSIDGQEPKYVTRTHTEGDGREHSVSNTFLLDLNATNQVWLQIKDTENPPQSITHVHGTFTMVEVGR